MPWAPPEDMHEGAIARLHLLCYNVRMSFSPFHFPRQRRLPPTSASAPVLKSNTMRILHLYKDYAPVLGGIENHIRVLAEAEAAAGHDVIVAVCMPQHGPRLPLERVENGVCVLRYPRVATLRSMPLSVPYWFAVRHLVRDVDVVHVHSPFPLGEAAVRTLPRTVRIIATHHSDVVRQKLLLRFYAPLYRTFLDRADLILPTSDAYAASSPWLRPHLAKCRTVPLGVDTQIFHPSQPSQPSHFPSPQPPTPDPHFSLLFVGRLRYYKGLDTLLHALSRLPENIRLDIVGDGPMGPAWKTLAADLHLQDRVRFLGEIPDADLPGAYRSADLFVLPCNCRAEAFGTVLAEALASGVPCITCDVGSGTSSVVRDGVSGRVVPPSDPAALAAAIRSLSEDRPLLSRMAVAAREDACTRLSDTVMVQSVMKCALHNPSPKQQ